MTALDYRSGTVTPRDWPPFVLLDDFTGYRQFTVPQPYLPIYHAMQQFTQQRDATTADEIWLLEHEPVFTQGMQGKPEHLRDSGNIPVIATDRGGQITYHGPGQLVMYLLLDWRRRQLQARPLVSALETLLIDWLASQEVRAMARRDAPGVYVGDAKLASIGLRLRRQGCYHGIAVNVAMDLHPFSRINPCGYEGLRMTQLCDLGLSLSLSELGVKLATRLNECLSDNAVN